MYYMRTGAANVFFLRGSGVRGMVCDRGAKVRKHEAQYVRIDEMNVIVKSFINRYIWVGKRGYSPDIILRGDKEDGGQDPWIGATRRGRSQGRKPRKWRRC